MIEQKYQRQQQQEQQELPNNSKALPVTGQQGGVAEVVGHHNGGVQGCKVQGGHRLPVVALLCVQHCRPLIPNLASRRPTHLAFHNVPST